MSQYVTYQKTRRTFRKRVITALIYHAFLVFFMICLVSSLMIWVIPRFAELYKNLDVPLPTLTVVLIDFSHGMRIIGVILLAAIVVAVLILRVAWRSASTRLTWDRIKFRLPLAGKLLLQFSVAEFARTLSQLLPGGLPVVSAMETTQEAVAGPLLGDAIMTKQQEGIARRCLDIMTRYAVERHAFGKPIAEFQAVQFQLAQAATALEAARLMVYNAARLRDAGQAYTSEAAMAKLFSSQVAERVTSLCVELFGGYGYTKEYPVEKFYRDAKIGTIYEGTNNMQLQTIAKLLMTP